MDETNDAFISCWVVWLKGKEHIWCKYSIILKSCHLILYNKLYFVSFSFFFLSDTTIPFSLTTPTLVDKKQLEYLQLF